MSSSPMFRFVWLLAFAVLAMGVAVHAAEHYSAVSSGDHHHEAEVLGCRHCCTEHAHSPAVMDHHVFTLVPPLTADFFMVVFGRPEAPTVELEYPPQLS